jgi:hypothetical protein
LQPSSILILIIENTFFINEIKASLFLAISISLSFSAFSLANRSSTFFRIPFYLLKAEASLPLAFLRTFREKIYLFPSLFWIFSAFFSTVFSRKISRFSGKKNLLNFQFLFRNSPPVTVLRDGPGERQNGRE